MFDYSNSSRYFASKVWNMVPPEPKNVNDVEMFISQIRKCEPTQCRCKPCLSYMQNVSYVNNISNTKLFIYHKVFYLL